MNVEVLKDTHVGERCFLLGSGPSLNDYDLSKLYDEQVFATLYFFFAKDYTKFNNLYLHYSARFPCNTGIMPGRYIPMSKRNKRAKFFYRKCFKEVNDEKNFYDDKDVFYLEMDKGKPLMEGAEFKTDISKPITMCGTIVADFMLPVIHYMGFDTVYVMGCDCTDTNAHEIPPHFYPNERMATIEQQLVIGYSDGFDSSDLNVIWDECRKKFESDGKKIYNTTDKTNLKVLEVVDYETLFDS